jgi:hypothetical protein
MAETFLHKRTILALYHSPVILLLDKISNIIQNKINSDIECKQKEGNLLIFKIYVAFIASSQPSYAT